MVCLEFCSNCGNKNKYGIIYGNKRHYCSACNVVHYENPKPTATLICPQKDNILLVKRAFNPGKGLWCLPGGFIEKGESLKEAAVRELKEETQLLGRALNILGTCSHYNTIFGDILLIGITVEVNDWSTMEAGDDAEEAKLFSIKKRPKLALPCHEKIVRMHTENVI